MKSKHCKYPGFKSYALDKQQYSELCDKCLLKVKVESYTDDPTFDEMEYTKKILTKWGVNIPDIDVMDICRMVRMQIRIQRDAL